MSVFLLRGLHHESVLRFYRQNDLHPPLLLFGTCEVHIPAHRPPPPPPPRPYKTPMQATFLKMQNLHFLQCLRAASELHADKVISAEEFAAMRATYLEQSLRLPQLQQDQQQLHQQQPQPRPQTRPKKVNPPAASPVPPPAASPVPPPAAPPVPLPAASSVAPASAVSSSPPPSVPPSAAASAVTPPVRSPKNPEDAPVKPVSSHPDDLHGYRFSTMDGLRLFVIAAMCQDGKELYNRRADKTRWNVECRGMVGDGEDAVSCAWQVKVKVSSDGYIIKCDAAHTCVGRATSGGGRYTSKHLKQEHKTSVTLVPHTPAQIQANTNAKASYQVAWRVQKAIQVEKWGNGSTSWLKIPFFFSKLREADSTTVATCGDDGVIKGPFLCLGSSIVAAPHLPPVFSADSTHLTGEGCSGVFYFFVGVDALSRIYPLACMWAPSETGVAWEEFLRSCATALALPHKATLYTDHFTGIESTVKRAVPDNWTHLLCGTHLKRTVKKFGKEVVARFDLLQRAASREDYDTTLEEIRRVTPAAKNYLQNLQRYFADVHAPSSTFRAFHYGTNVAESSNNWLGTARKLPILGLLDTFREKMMDLVSTRMHESQALEDVELTSYWRSRVENICTSSEAYTAIPSRRFGDTEPYSEFQIRLTAASSSGRRYTVIIPRNPSEGSDPPSCSCPHLSMHGICVHFAAALISSGKQVDLYLPAFMKNRALKQTYSSPVAPISCDGFEVDETRMAPPLKARGLGRPKEKRIRANEGRAKKKRKVEVTVAVTREDLQESIRTADTRVPMSKHQRGGEGRAECECGWAAVNWVLVHNGHPRVPYSLLLKMQDEVGSTVRSEYSSSENAEDSILGGWISHTVLSVLLLSRGTLVTHHRNSDSESPRGLVGFFFGPSSDPNANHWATVLAKDNQFDLKDTDAAEQSGTLDFFRDMYSGYQVYCVRQLSELTVASLKQEASDRKIKITNNIRKDDLIELIQQNALSQFACLSSDS